MKETSVAPGQNATFEFALLAPTLLTGVDYSEYFTPVAEGVTWMNDLKLHYDVKVKAATYTWQVVSQTAYSDPALTATTSLDSMGPGEKKYVRITFRNTGNVTLVNSGPNALKLGTSRPFNRNSVFVSNEWLSSSRPAALAESSVAPGEIGTFVIALQAPSDPKYTSYSEHFMPVSEWVSWLSNQEIRYVINVQ